MRGYSVLAFTLCVVNFAQVDNTLTYEDGPTTDVKVSLTALPASNELTMLDALLGSVSQRWERHRRKTRWWLRPFVRLSGVETEFVMVLPEWELVAEVPGFVVELADRDVSRTNLSVPRQGGVRD